MNVRHDVSRRAFAAGAVATLAAGGSLNAAPMPPANITLGDEVFLRDEWRKLRGRGVGVVTNQTGVTSQLESIVDAIRRNSEIRLRAIYSPEHGLRGDRTAGAYVPSYVDERTGLPVYSLYGSTRRPSEAMLHDVDVLLFDIQDVGSRAYTYISTMAYVMEAAKKFGKSVWVLDRPNPIGDAVEGPVLDPHFSSFIGLYPIAMRHGMTVGELAKMFNAHFGIGCELNVIPMVGYRRSMLWPDTGLAWVQSSPNIPQWETTLLYPGTGLIDGAGVNNGTGSTKPFQYAGAYGLDSEKLAAILNARPIPGAHFRPASWSPIGGFWAGKTLSGVEIVVTDAHAIRVVRVAVEILVAVRGIDERLISVKSPAGLDRDWGTDSLRRTLLAGADADTILAQWKAGAQTFATLQAPYLAYA